MRQPIVKADKILFPGTTWWLLLLIPAVFFGFYQSYFSRLFHSMDSIFHIHAFFMSLWVILAIVQPFLIKRKKIKWHRAMGRLSYIIMPLVLISGYLMIRHAYFDRIGRAMAGAGSDAAPDDKAAIVNAVREGIAIGIVYLAWLALFYGLAVACRKRMVYHATFMFAAILTMLGPTIDRVIYHVYDYFGIRFNFLAEIAVFVLIDMLLIGLLYYQWKKGYTLRPATIALTVYLAGQLGYFLLPKTQAWKGFVILIMQ